MADETTTTTASASVPSETFATGIRLYPRVRPACLSVAWMETTKGIVPCSFERLSTASPVPAGTKTEGASFTRTSQASSATQITPAFVGMELALTDELLMSLHDGSMFQQATVIDRVRAMAVRAATDLMATITGSSNTAGDTATELTRTGLMTAIGQYWSLNLEAEQHAILLSNAAATQLGEDTVASTATSVELQNQFGASILLGSFQGMVVLRAGEAPAEGVGYSSMITPVGDVSSGLLFGVSEGINARPPTRGSEGERDAETYQIIRSMYGVADDDGYYLELQTAA